MEETKFPLTFNQCPNCGSIRRIGNEVLEQEKEKGRAGKDMIGFLFNHSGVVADQRKTMLSVPLISTLFDACMDCGAVYCVHADVKQVVVGMYKPPPGPSNN